MRWHYAVAILFVWVTFSGAACVRMLVPPPERQPTAAERLAEMKQTMEILKAMQAKPATAATPALENEVSLLWKVVEELKESIRRLLYKSVDHEYCLKQVLYKTGNLDYCLKQLEATR